MISHLRCGIFYSSPAGHDGRFGCGIKFLTGENLPYVWLTDNGGHLANLKATSPFEVGP